MHRSQKPNRRRSGPNAARRSPISGAATALAVVALAFLAACSGTDNSADATGDTTRRTVAEEASTTVPSANTTLSGNRSPLPDPEWAGTAFDLEPIATLDTPIAMANRAGSDDLWVAERNGRVRRIERRLSPSKSQEQIKLLDEPVLDISNRVGTDGEGGLLGIEFSLNGRQLYASYTDLKGDSVVSQFLMNGDVADPESEEVILTLDQPYANHNGGDIMLGPDGFLYIGFGDGGDGGDPHDNGQNLQTWLGKILRIDPGGSTDDKPYAIPSSNPFVNRSDVPDEIWLYGVRNPWRFSFDMATGDLWVADVGQSKVEEVTLLRAGSEAAGKRANLGWRTMEGELVFDDRGMADPTVALADYEGPIHTYSHENGRCSVTGGYVYRGARLPKLRGTYVYSDYCSGEVWGLNPLRDGRAVWSTLATPGNLVNPISFGQDIEGELYALQSDGNIVRLQDNTWRRSTELLGPNDPFTFAGLEAEVLRGDGAEERFDGPSSPPPPTFLPTTTSTTRPTLGG